MYPKTELGDSSSGAKHARETGYEKHDRDPDFGGLERGAVTLLEWVLGYSSDRTTETCCTNI